MSRPENFPYAFGKAISGGRPVDAEEMARLTQDQLADLKTQLSKPALEKTDDELSRRIAQEVDYSRRLLEQVEAELRRRNGLIADSGATLRRVEEAEEILEDLAAIVDAKNRCEAIKRARPGGVQARLLRRSIDGTGAVCDDKPDRERGRLRRS
jgi:hypothetical protein